ncbi:MAG: hypothetical protein KGM47_16845, partial [Acidobacteriota bacterium]|nr:hypothetical protein [Acidobacteriota bacterium]
QDRVTMDLKLSVEDSTVSDLKDNPFELTDERHGLFSGMDEQIVGGLSLSQGRPARGGSWARCPCHVK